jgi:hypothetical protein
MEDVSLIPPELPMGAPPVPPPMPVGPQDSGIPTDEKQFFNDVIEAAKKQACKDSKISKHFIKLFKEGQFQEGEGASANFTFSDVSLLMAVLLARDPNIVVTPQNVGDLASFDVLVMNGLFPDAAMAQETYGTVLEKVETFTWRDTKTQTHINAALFNSIVTGMGVIKTSFDEARQVARSDAFAREEFYIDPTARYDLTQAKYVTQCCVLPIEEARVFFGKIGYTGEIKANYRLSQGESLLADMAKENEADKRTDRFYRFYEIWRKTPDGQRLVYYRDYDTEKWLYQRPWPFVLGVDDFPFSTLVFSQQYQQAMDAFTDLLTINGLRAAYENIVEFYRQHVFKGIASKIVYDKSAFGEQDMESLLNSHDMEVIGATLGGQPIDQYIQKLTFTDDASTIIELASSLKDIKDEIFGIADIQRGGSSEKLTAKQAGIEDDWGRQRINRRQAILDAFLEDILTKRTKVDLLLCPAEKIARIVGQQNAMLWDMFDGDIEELHCLYSITIAAGSTGADAKHKKLQEMERQLKLMDGINATQPTPVFDTVKFALEILKLDDLPHPERYILGPLMPKMPPASAGPMPMDGQAADPAGSNNQGSQGIGPGGNAPMQTLPGESEPGAPPPQQ